jgi:hypothetical protein
MKSEDFQSLLRYVVAIGAGYAIKSGHLDPGEVETVIGIVTGLAAIVASQMQRARRRKAASAAAPYQPGKF